MLGSNSKKTNKVDTVIGKNTKLEGKIEAKGTIRLDGELVGDLIIEGSAIIGKNGKIKGNVVCSNIFVSGTIEGNVDCKEQLRLTNTGQISGDIKVKTFIVDENAVFEGKCQMQDAVQTSKKKNADKVAQSEKNLQKANKGA